MIEKKLKSAFTLVTGILLGAAGTGLYADAQKDKKLRDDFKTEVVERHVLNLGTVDTYSRDNLPMQARISIAGINPAGLQDENNVRNATVQTLKQQITQKSAEELGVDQQLDAMRPAFAAQKEAKPDYVVLELPPENLSSLSRSLMDAVRHTAAKNLDRDAEVRLTVEVTLQTRNVERYYERKDKQAQVSKAQKPLGKL